MNLVSSEGYNIGNAAYPGECWVCGEPINIGDPIVRPGANGWIHRECYLNAIIEQTRQRHGQ